MANARMVKKNAETKQTETQTDTVESVNTTEVTVESKTSDVTLKSAEKGVKVKLGKDHSCCIGKIYYHFKANETYTVPADVKDILSRGDLLKPLD